MEEPTSHVAVEEKTADTEEQADGNEPSSERQAELRAAYESNIIAGRAPYADVRIRTLGEVHWIQRERDWSTDIGTPAGQCINLSGANLRKAVLSGTNLSSATLNGTDLSDATLNRTKLNWASLRGAELSNATLDDADLSGATLSSANLDGVTLRGANLSSATLNGTSLIGATLSSANLMGARLNNAELFGATLAGTNLHFTMLNGTNLSNATLSGANLRFATLSGTDLSGATLSGADLRDARMDDKTLLAGVVLDTKTRVGDVFWSGASLTRVDWGQACRLGDEEAVQEAKTRERRIVGCQSAARAYRGLAIALRAQGLLPPASDYRLREQRLERKAAWHSRRYGEWLFSALLDLVAGYGEALERILISYVVVVGGFAAAYWAVTHYLETKLSALSWDEALVLSLTSFHGRGFFPGFLSLGDWVARLGALEAVIGLFIELILIATFSRRFLGN